MLEAFNELMADPGAYILSLRIRSLLRRLRYGTDRPRVIVGHATNF